MVAPTVFIGARAVKTTFLYDDPEHPDRPTGTVASAPYVVEDHALLMALGAYEGDRCGCGQPRAVAWHSEMDGWFEGESYVCHACSAQQGRKVVYTVAVDTRPPDRLVLPPFVLGVTTTSE